MANGLAPADRLQVSVDTATVVETMEAAFASSPGLTFGLEVELFTALADGSRPPYELLTELTRGAVHAHGRISIEPGSQLEVSTAPCTNIAALLQSLDSDVAALRERAEAVGVTTWVGGIDVSRRPSRTCPLPRYAVMETHLDRYGTAGRWMMTNTAALQINVSHGDGTLGSRWRLFSRLAPLLTAIFSNSSGRSSSGEQWWSLRQGCWSSMDPRRCGIPSDRTSSAPESYLEYAMDAPVMMIWEGDAAHPAPPALTMRSWVSGHGPRSPTLADFDYHLTTLFPPVRPKGWLELRCLDMIPRPCIEVALLVTQAVCDPAVAAELETTLTDVPGMRQAAQAGLSSPTIHRSARRLFAIVAEHAQCPTVDDFRSDFVERGRSIGEAANSQWYPTL